MYLAPAGRHVYSTRHAPNTLKPQRGDRCSLSESQIRPIQPKTPIKKCRVLNFGALMYLAPEGRHDSTLHKYPKAPERHVLA